MEAAFGSACHGAGRSTSRHQATRRRQGRHVVDQRAAGVDLGQRSREREA